ncbi:MAG: rod shape-determining protein MreD [Ignavibacteriales bacterium]
MKLVIISVIVSFFLDSILTSFIPIDSIFIPLFSLISLIVIYPYFHKEQNSYLKFSFLIGLLYDIVYTDTIFLNAFIFLLIGFCIKLIHEYISNNAFNISIMSLCVVAIYRFITYFVLVMINYLNYNFNDLLVSIYSSLIVNVIYGIILYLTTDFISRKYKIDKIE